MPDISSLPTSLADLPVGILEGLSIWGIYRALGFSADDIYAAFEVPDVIPSGRIYPQGPHAGQPVPDDCLCVFIALKAQGLEFLTDYPEPDVGKDTFPEIWTRAGRIWNDATVLERRAIIQSSWVHDHLESMLYAMITKGFKFPAVPHLEDVQVIIQFLSAVGEA